MYELNCGVSFSSQVTITKQWTKPFWHHYSRGKSEPTEHRWRSLSTRLLCSTAHWPTDYQGCQINIPSYCYWYCCHNSTSIHFKMICDCNNGLVEKQYQYYIRTLLRLYLNFYWDLYLSCIFLFVQYIIS